MPSMLPHQGAMLALVVILLGSTSAAPSSPAPSPAAPSSPAPIFKPGPCRAQAATRLGYQCRCDCSRPFDGRPLYGALPGLRGVGLDESPCVKTLAHPGRRPVCSSISSVPCSSTLMPGLILHYTIGTQRPVNFCTQVVGPTPALTADTVSFAVEVDTLLMVGEQPGWVALAFAAKAGQMWPAQAIVSLSPSGGKAVTPPNQLVRRGWSGAAASTPANGWLVQRGNLQPSLSSAAPAGPHPQPDWLRHTPSRPHAPGR